jgi:hypothetical protein
MPTIEALLSASETYSIRMEQLNGYLQAKTISYDEYIDMREQSSKEYNLNVKN